MPSSPLPNDRGREHRRLALNGWPFLCRNEIGLSLMQALHFIKVGKLEWHDTPDLRVDGQLEAIVRPIASTTCDLDRRIINGLISFGENFPIGHECVAEVVEVGGKVKTVRPGDVVVVPWHISCGVCVECRRGLSAACSSAPGIAGYGIPIAGRWGGLFSEEVRVPFADGMLVRLPDGVDPVAAASVSDNLTEAYIAVSRGMAGHPGAPVLVVSSLPSLGLFAVDHAMAAGAARVDFVDASEERREAARGLGAYVHAGVLPEFDMRFPVVINVAREPEMLAAAVRCLAPGGHISNAAIFFADTPLPLWEMYKRDVTFSTGTASVSPHLPKVLELLRCGHIHPERLITTHRWEDATSALLEPDMKPVIVRPRLLA